MVPRDDKRGALLATTLLPLQWCRLERSWNSPAGPADRADPIVDLASPTDRHQQEANQHQPTLHRGLIRPGPPPSSRPSLPEATP